MYLFTYLVKILVLMYLQFMIYVIIYGLFNSVVSMLDYIALNCHG
jgi:hypothetical protein